MRRAKQSGAFTLTELLTAATLGLGIVALVLSGFRATADLWRRSEERIDTAREARAALEMMERDLALTLGPFGEVATLRLGHAPETGQADRANEALYAVCAPSGQAEAGPLALIGYYCRWNAQASSYELVRRWAPVDDPAVLAQEATFFDAPNGVEEVLARYIWALQIRPIAADGSAAAYPGVDGGGPLPRWIEVRFQAAGPLAVEKLSGLAVTRATWTTPGDPVFERVIAPHQQSYAVRIRLQNAP